MSETPSKSILSRIRGLLAKAESTEFPHEAEALTAKAAELIAKYGIDQALLKTDDGAPPTPGDRRIMVQNPYGRDKADLLGVVARGLRCQAIQQVVPGGLRLHLFGYAADLDRVELLYTSLLMQQATALAAAEPHRPWGESLQAWKRSWMHGYAIAIQERLKAAERHAEQVAERDRAAESGPSVALVLADRNDRVAQLVADTYPKLRTARRRLSGSGGWDGMAAGRRANLGGTGVGSGAGRALSN